jgi:hypothetical protein
MSHTAIVSFCIAAMGMPIIKERGFPHPQPARKERLFLPPPRRRRYPQAEIHGEVVFLCDLNHEVLKKPVVEITPGALH